MFIPNDFENFHLSREVYDVLLKATSYQRENRYESIKEFYREFKRVLDIESKWLKNE